MSTFFNVFLGGGGGGGGEGGRRPVASVEFFGFENISF